jgi:hypothetical protein
VRRRCLSVALALSLGACAAPAQEARMSSRIEDGMMNREVLLEGVAQNAKAGPVLVLDGGSPVYLAGLDTWPKDQLGKRARVRGVLRSRKLIPDPNTGDGFPAAGAEGEQIVLEGPQIAK